MHSWKTVSLMVHCIYKILWQLQSSKIKTTLGAHINIKERKRGRIGMWLGKNSLLPADFQLKFSPVTSPGTLRHNNWLTIGPFHHFPQSQTLLWSSIPKSETSQSTVWIYWAQPVTAWSHYFLFDRFLTSKKCLMCDENKSPKQFPFWKQYLVKHKKDQIGMDRILVEKV